MYYYILNPVHQYLLGYFAAALSVFKSKFIKVNFPNLLCIITKNRESFFMKEYD